VETYSTPAVTSFVQIEKQPPPRFPHPGTSCRMPAGGAQRWFPVPHFGGILHEASLPVVVWGAAA